MKEIVDRRKFISNAVLAAAAVWARGSLFTLLLQSCEAQPEGKNLEKYNSLLEGKSLREVLEYMNDVLQDDEEFQLQYDSVKKDYEHVYWSDEEKLQLALVLFAYNNWYCLDLVNNFQSAFIKLLAKRKYSVESAKKVLDQLGIWNILTEKTIEVGIVSDDAVLRNGITAGEQIFMTESKGKTWGLFARQQPTSSTFAHEVTHMCMHRTFQIDKQTVFSVSTDVKTYSATYYNCNEFVSNVVWATFNERDFTRMWHNTLYAYVTSDWNFPLSDVLYLVYVKSWEVINEYIGEEVVKKTLLSQEVQIVHKRYKHRKSELIASVEENYQLLMEKFKDVYVKAYIEDNQFVLDSVNQSMNLAKRELTRKREYEIDCLEKDQQNEVFDLVYTHIDKLVARMNELTEEHMEAIKQEYRELAQNIIANLDTYRK